LSEAISKHLMSKDTVNGECYVAPVYNFFAKQGKRVCIFDLGPVSKVMFGLGTPFDCESFLASDSLAIALKQNRRRLASRLSAKSVA